MNCTRKKKEECQFPSAEGNGKNFAFVRSFCLALLQLARDLFHSLSHTGSNFGIWFETESLMPSILPQHAVKPSIYWNQASQHCSASTSTIPSPVLPSSEEKGKRKPRMEKSRTGELSPDLDLIWSHLIREVNLERWKYLLWNSLSNGNTGIISKVHRQSAPNQAAQLLHTKQHCSPWPCQAAALMHFAAMPSVHSGTHLKHSNNYVDVHTCFWALLFRYSKEKFVVFQHKLVSHPFTPYNCVWSLWSKIDTGRKIRVLF